MPREKITGEFGESSWVNHTLDTWIGEKQENMAWMVLENARNALLVNNVSGEEKENAEKSFMRTEGNDWFWWYGSDQVSGNDQPFDRFFKMYPFEIYSTIGKTLPEYLFGNYFPDGTPYRYVTLDLEKRKYTEVPVIQSNAKIELLYDGDLIKVKTDVNEPKIEIGIFGGKSIDKPFFLVSEPPHSFSMNPFP